MLREAVPSIPRLGRVFTAPIDVILDRHNIVQPDIIFIRKDRLKIIGPKNIQGPPDLVIEVLSPSTRRTDVKTKSAIYARFGVPSYWMVDPKKERLEVYRLEGATYALEGAFTRPEVAAAGAFPGLEAPLDEVFGE